MAETFQDKLARVLREEVAVVDYDPSWPRRFEEERARLRELLPANLVRRIEHFGSTAVPGLAAKPIIDILVEVPSLFEARRRIVPVLEAEGYEYFWRPTFGGELPAYYAWFIKRDVNGNRTHHLHLIESHFSQWDSLLFRDYLIDHPDAAAEYGELKRSLSSRHRYDREAYSKAKGEFIRRITRMAKQYYRKAGPKGC